MQQTCRRRGEAAIGGRGNAGAVDLDLPAHALDPGLHLVATPIGNLGDVTLRALWVLRGVDRILCEDTRVTARLLARFGIDKPLDAYHDHNADRMRPLVLAALRRGETRALVSDAGTPLVSDPGYKLVREALDEGLPVTAALRAAGCALTGADPLGTAARRLPLRRLPAAALGGAPQDAGRVARTRRDAGLLRGAIAASLRRLAAHG